MSRTFVACCTYIASCPPGHTWATSAAAAHSKTCTTCPPGRFKEGSSVYSSTDTGGCIVKTNITSCPAGHVLGAVTDAYRDSKCACCPTGKFKAGTSAGTTCTTKTNLTTCPSGQFVDVSDNTRDTTCIDRKNESACRGRTRMGDRQLPTDEVLTLATGISEDNTCTKCPAGMFKSYYKLNDGRYRDYCACRAPSGE